MTSDDYRDALIQVMTAASKLLDEINAADHSAGSEFAPEIGHLRKAIDKAEPLLG